MIIIYLTILAVNDRSLPRKRRNVLNDGAPTKNAAPDFSEAAFGSLGARALQQAGAARPFVLGAEHRDRDFGRVGVGDDAVLV
jgi:hypothetical protein